MNQSEIIREKWVKKLGDKMKGEQWKCEWCNHTLAWNLEMPVVTWHEKGVDNDSKITGKRIPIILRQKSPICRSCFLKLTMEDKRFY